MALLDLKTWASRTFEGNAPSAITLRRWVAAGRIKPSPIKIGRSYFVSSDAVAVGRTRSDMGGKRGR